MLLFKFVFTPICFLFLQLQTAKYVGGLLQKSVLHMTNIRYIQIYNNNNYK